VDHGARQAGKRAAPVENSRIAPTWAMRRAWAKRPTSAAPTRRHHDGLLPSRMFRGQSIDPCPNLKAYLARIG
jgi:hypothetical protein